MNQEAAQLGGLFRVGWSQNLYTYALVSRLRKPMR